MSFMRRIRSCIFKIRSYVCRFHDSVQRFEIILRKVAIFSTLAWVVFAIYINISESFNYELAYLKSFASDSGTFISVTSIFLIFISLILRLIRKNPIASWCGVLSEYATDRLDRWLYEKTNIKSFQNFCRTLNEKEIYDFTMMNHKAFYDSSFMADVDVFLLRNYEMLCKNKEIVQMISDPISGVDIGYTCVIPLTDEGRDLYVDSKIKDAKLSSSLIATCGQEFSCALLFAIHLVDEFQVSSSGASVQYVNLLKKVIAFHIEQMYKICNRDSKFILYVQAEKPSLIRHLKKVGFVDSGIQSGDGYELYEYEYAGATV